MRSDIQQSNTIKTPIPSATANGTNSLSTAVVTTIEQSNITSSSNQAFLTPIQVSQILGAGWSYTSSGNVTQYSQFMSYNFTQLNYENINYSKALTISVYNFSNYTLANSFLNEVVQNITTNSKAIKGLSIHNGTSGHMKYFLLNAANASLSKVMMYISINDTGILLFGAASNTDMYVFNLSQGLQLASTEYSQHSSKPLSYIGKPETIGSMIANNLVFVCYREAMSNCTVNNDLGYNPSYAYNDTINLNIQKHFYSNSTISGPITVYLVGGKNYTHFNGICSLPYCASNEIPSTSGFIKGVSTNILIYNSSNVEVYSENAGASYDAAIWISFYSNNSIEYSPLGTIVIT
jgi:hypothetical protein